MPSLHSVIWTAAVVLLGLETAFSELLQVDKRIDKMKTVLDYKEATIDELRSRLEKTKVPGGATEGNANQVIDSNRENLMLMTEALRDREDQIEQLQEKVKQASR